ncbi:hypothetical protein PAECIP111893_04007 [Paenibacillus plantiphilus]|uniref:Mga helix-turn-helix domain-containing protein n=1 Tax=Paenibacillus plantiphilus TaxID=2905650 RepID=A0ABN8GTX4_9BACL|nr:hypothetical protein [Paenibacillus plantiphilus]CAH1215695.1 hypothetical protein PAECIP111893_04007 [Paenibacillus plantiphilus]
MTFHKYDFEVLNISNIPSSEERMDLLINMFGEQYYSNDEMVHREFNSIFDYSRETFRKMLNHSFLVGVLDRSDNVYRLSSVSLSYFHKRIDFTEFMHNLIVGNSDVYKTMHIIIYLLKIFNPSLKMKTLYTIFSLLGKNRIDPSAQSSVGRNLRAYFSFLTMLGLVKREKDELVLTESSLHSDFLTNDIIGIEELFDTEVINIKSVTNYMLKFFDKPAADDILSCVSSYEIDRYIWTKSSLYKNQGEIKNLYGEYIMTLIIKKGRF